MDGRRNHGHAARSAGPRQARREGGRCQSALPERGDACRPEDRHAMTRLNLVLMLAVLFSALYLVRTQYESRSLFVELDRAVTLAHKLEVENERLQVEKR